MKSIKKFALIGVGGYIAPRHLEAIKTSGNELVAALDKNDSVGVLDSYFPSCSFFTEFERFDRHLEKMRYKGEKIDYLTICSPNYLHDAHIRFGLRIGANIICEKPLVLNPWNIDPLEEIERETNKKINVILQSRLHSSLIKLKKEIDKDKTYDVELTYITSRGKWYSQSWKGEESKSGGIVTNIGIHFFDLLGWLWGKKTKNTIHIYREDKAAGYLELEKARIKWFLSVDNNDLPLCFEKDIQKKFYKTGFKTYRSLKVNGEETEFSKLFTNLHTRSYKKILKNKGFGTKDARPSIEIVSEIRKLEPIGLRGEYHSLLSKIK